MDFKIKIYHGYFRFCIGVVLFLICGLIPSCKSDRGVSCQDRTTRRLQGLSLNRSETKTSNKCDRRFHIINLSLPRTGSTSLAAMFQNYRSKHEFMQRELVNTISYYFNGKISENELDAFLILRDKKGSLEVDASTSLQFVAERVVSLFPDAKFIFIVRDGASWILSSLAMLRWLGRTGKEEDPAYVDWIERYGKLFISSFKFPLFATDVYLRNHSKHIISGLADFWGKQTLNVLELLRGLPEDRRLVLQLKDLDYSIQRLAQFAGVDPGTLVKAHLNRARTHDKEQIKRLVGGKKVLEAAAKDYQRKINMVLKEFE